MLTTVLMLAAALNLEPTRAGVTALILAGPNPIRRLAAFLCGIYVAGLVVGVLVLFVFHHALLGRTDIPTGKVQIAIGVAAIVIAVFLFADIKLPQRRRRSPAADGVTIGADDTPSEIAHTGFLTKLLTHSTRISNNSPVWALFVLGLACSLPSIDFMALLLLIAASGAPAAAQVGSCSSSSRWETWPRSCPWCATAWRRRRHCAEWSSSGLGSGHAPAGTSR